MPPAVVVVTADSQSEDNSQEIEVVEMQTFSAPSPELRAESGSQHSLASIEGSPVEQEMGEETVKIQFQQ